MFIVFPVKLFFDIGHKSLRQGLNGRVRKKVVSVYRRMELMCVYMEIDHAHKEIRIGV
jgi:hypothetical protein